MIIRHHYDIDDTTFEQQFATGTFPARLFSHEAHLRLAWIHLRRYGLEKALFNMRHQIRQFAIQVGVPDKYHETITSAAVYAVHHFMQKSAQSDFPAFIEANSALQHDFKSLINSHYSSDIFKNEAARRTFIQPDVQPFLP